LIVDKDTLKKLATYCFENTGFPFLCFPFVCCGAEPSTLFGSDFGEIVLKGFAGKRARELETPTFLEFR